MELKRNLFELPPEIILQIFGYFDLETLLNWYILKSSRSM
jgi:hypothetical protein